MLKSRDLNAIHSRNINNNNNNNNNNDNNNDSCEPVRVSDKFNTGNLKLEDFNQLLQVY